MARPRTFDVDVVIDAAATTFAERGYEATSVDDLLRATGLQRGSLYQAFASKRGLFLAALDRTAAHAPGSPRSTDLLLVAALELAPHDAEVRARVTAAAQRLHDPAVAWGRRLLERAGASTAVAAPPPP